MVISISKDKLENQRELELLIEDLQRDNPFLLVKGMSGKNYDLIEYFVNSDDRNNFRDHDLYLANFGVSNPAVDLIVNNFSINQRMFPRLAMDYAEKIVRPYLAKSDDQYEVGRVLVFAKPDLEVCKNIPNSPSFKLDQRVCSFIEHFKILDLN